MAFAALTCLAIAPPPSCNLRRCRGDARSVNRPPTTHPTTPTTAMARISARMQNNALLDCYSMHMLSRCLLSTRSADTPLPQGTPENAAAQRREKRSTRAAIAPTGTTKRRCDYALPTASPAPTHCSHAATACRSVVAAPAAAAALPSSAGAAAKTAAAHCLPDSVAPSMLSM